MKVDVQLAPARLLRSLSKKDMSSPLTGVLGRFNRFAKYLGGEPGYFVFRKSSLYNNGDYLRVISL